MPHKNAEAKRAYMQMYRAANRERVRAHDRKAGVKRKFARHNIAAEEFIDILKSQGGGCAICGDVEVADGRGTGWRIDHDPSLGCHPGNGAFVGSCAQCRRGILCHRCNSALGLFRDDPALLHSAITYLQNQ